MFGLPSPYVLVAGASIGVAAIGGSFFMGVHYADRGKEIASLQSLVDAMTADQKIDKDARDRASFDAASIEAADAANQEIIRDLQSQLAAAPAADRCPAGADFARRLRDIR